MIHPRHNAHLIKRNRKRVKSDSTITVPCWDCHGLRVTDLGHCKTCWGKGTLVVEPNPMGMNPHHGHERN